ncbi:wall-associated receptor kinase-like 15 [Mangifera indica]|uniref:wall-associated receptor kinase-like 15 n=1 Tax=Mangifera indica TaxID=29780 RepID=UPI001CFA4CEA|nr:wall-associated receptor kinase-like 15 [Mangifera indica]XP_044480872.1 wall-associated receptor kinase-like 15 [Mangifera indica]
MKLPYPSITLLFFFSLIRYLPSLVSSQPCQRSCGTLPIKYPFGSGPGCGDPRFQQFVTCNDQKLTLTTHTGCYPITDIDYMNQVIYLTDPSMSTCACTQPSKGFGLDWNAPFSFHEDNVFTLLDCSIASSPIYKSSTFNGDNSSAVVPLCDKNGVAICSYLYSCRAISTLNLPISTCCVYAPVDLGPSFDMDLQKLQCSSYSGFYSFSGQEYNPENWKYGIALKYKFNVYNDYPGTCANCEKSNGACGYGGAYNSFICNCPSEANTTTDCFFESTFNNAQGLLPWKTGTRLTGALTLILVWVML